MEKDDSKYDGELTSTMGNLMSLNKDDKNEANDSTPTSSTDAFTATSSTQIAPEDPISSTSSDTQDAKKREDQTIESTKSEEVQVDDKPAAEPLMASEKDWLTMSITDTATEKITEDVEDIVQDLENLLGEPTTSFTIKTKENRRSGGKSGSQTRNVSVSNAETQGDSPAEKSLLTAAVEEPNPVVVDLSEVTLTDSVDSKTIETKESQRISEDAEKSDLEIATIETSDEAAQQNQEVRQTEICKSDSIATIETSGEGGQQNQEVGKTEICKSDSIETSDKGGQQNQEVGKTEICKSDSIATIETSDEGGQQNQEVGKTEICKSDSIVESAPDTDTTTESLTRAENVGTPVSLPVIKDETGSEVIVPALLEDNRDGSSIEPIISESSKEVGDNETVPMDTNDDKDAIDNTSVATTSEVSAEKCDDNVILEATTDNSKTIEKKSVPADDQEMVEAPLAESPERAEAEPIVAEKVSIEVIPVESTPDDPSSEKKLNEAVEVSEIDAGSSEVDKFESVASEVSLNAPVDFLTEANVVGQPITVEETNQDKLIVVQENIESVDDVDMVESGDLGVAEIDEAAIAIQNISPNLELVSILPDCVTELEEKEELSVAALSELPSEVLRSVEIDPPEVLLPSVIAAQPITEAVSFDPCVDEIFSGPAELQDDNLETLLAVASLQNDSDTSYTIPPIDDIPTIVSEKTSAGFQDPLELQPESLPLPKSLTLQTETLTLTETSTLPTVILTSEVGSRQLETETHLPESLALQPETASLLSGSVALQPEAEMQQEGVGKLFSESLPLQPETAKLLPETSTLQSEPETPQPEGVKILPESLAVSSKGLALQPELKTTKFLPENLALSSEGLVPVQLQPKSLVESVALSPKKISLQSPAVTLQSKVVAPQTESKVLSLQSSETQPKTPWIENLDLPSVSLERAPVELKHLSQKPQSVVETVSKPLRSEVVSAISGVTSDVTVTKKDVTGKKLKQSHEEETKLKEPLVINVEVTDKERHYSPKIIIKPIKPVDDEPESKGSLKMTITKQSDTMHSILKIYDPENDHHDHQEEVRHKNKSHDSQESHSNEPTIPKLIIKPIAPLVDQHSPKMSTRSSKQVFSPSSSGNQRSSSPRITIKPIIKPESVVESVSPLKITIKPVLKPEDSHRQKHSPKLTIKPVVKPDDDAIETKVHSPRVTIKPIVKPPEEQLEPIHSPRITIKPIVKPPEIEATTPRVTIKPVLKPQEDSFDQPIEKSPKITIKPIVKPVELESQVEEDPKERIVLKINKSAVRESRKRDFPDEEKSEKLGKIKLKFSKEGGHPHIVQESSHKRSSESSHDHDRGKRLRNEESALSGVTITPINPSHSKLKEMLSIQKGYSSSDHAITIDDDDDVTIVENITKKSSSPIVISEESNQESNSEAKNSTVIFEVNPEIPKEVVPVVEVAPLPPTPRKRGRPRKVPLEVREEFKDPKEEEPPKPVVVESTRPKRSCRGQSVRTTLGIKPRKPRGPGRGRGGKRGVGTRGEVAKPAKEPKLSAAKLKLLKEDLIALTAKPAPEPDDAFVKSPPALAPPSETSNTSTGSPTDRVPDIVMYEEETRMSAETNSRAQTPAKQVVTSTPAIDVEESQSSVQSTATTESAKARRGPRLEVHQEPEGAVISADQLAEYYWSGGGPYMLQEQVAQFLGIKSFKRKYPNIQRRFVDMQERDFIRESGLAGEAMCDLGLTAVSSTDILDIMYSDFQDKYEEYCKHQRERQAKDLTNKQKALSLAASQEKTKMDIMQQAVQSAASWNSNFNKERKEQRKACMDLQTLTVHFPKGKMKETEKTKVGHYPVALVPGQFTDHYGEFTPTEINNLPLNTMCYETINKVPEMECDSQTDGSGSESDSSSSDSDSSFSGSSDGEDCTLCNKHQGKRVVAAI